MIRDPPLFRLKMASMGDESFHEEKHHTGRLRNVLWGIDAEGEVLERRSEDLEKPRHLGNITGGNGGLSDRINRQKAIVRRNPIDHAERCVVQ
jgi:hypothetical protein